MSSLKTRGGSNCTLALMAIGKPAVRPVREQWAALDDLDRWKLMAFRGRHDYAAALPFALASLDSESDAVYTSAARYLADHREAKAVGPLVKRLNAGKVRSRWVAFDALRTIKGPEVVEAFIKLLAPESWVVKGEGNQVPRDGGRPPWWPDGRPYVFRALYDMGAKEAVPAALRVLRERGPGKAYLGHAIVPFLAEFGGPECLPELQRIAAARPEDIDPTTSADGPIHPKVTEAIRAIKSRSPY